MFTRRQFLAASAAAAATVPQLAALGTSAQTTTPRVVLAYYYPWFTGNPYYRHWGGTNPPSQGVYDPVLGAYASGAQATLNQHVSWARNSAGIDVLISSWWGRSDLTDQNLRPLLDAAQAVGLKVCPMIEPYSGRTANSVGADVAYLIDTYGTHPAFYHLSRSTYFGPTTELRPVVFVFQTPLSDPNWIAVADTLHGAPAYDPFLIVDTDDASLTNGTGIWNAMIASHADGFFNYGCYDYSASPLPLTDPSYLMVPGVAPGWNDTRNGQGGRTVIGRENGARYDRSWGALVAAGSYEAIAVVSFNEWQEGHQIESAQALTYRGYHYQDYNGAYGLTGGAALTAYLNRTAYWGGRYRAT